MLWHENSFTNGVYSLQPYDIIFNTYPWHYITSEGLPFTIAAYLYIIDLVGRQIQGVVPQIPILELRNIAQYLISKQINAMQLLMVDLDNFIDIAVNFEQSGMLPELQDLHVQLNWRQYPKI